MGDDDEGSLLLLDSGGDSVNTDSEGSLSGVSGVSLSGGPGIKMTRCSLISFCFSNNIISN